MTREEIAGRARYAAEHSVAKYKLGAGGFNPKAPLPENSAGNCDCSGFASWAIGESRQTTNAFLRAVNGGWIETSAVVKDAKSPDGMFTAIADPEPGDLIVWGDARGSQGHIGVISTVDGARATKVIHCSSGNSRVYGRAIRETDAGIFYRNNAICVRFDGAEEDPQGPKGNVVELPRERRAIDAKCAGVKR